LDDVLKIGYEEFVVVVVVDEEMRESKTARMEYRVLSEEVLAVSSSTSTEG
jgi:hypothetical protein